MSWGGGGGERNHFFGRVDCGQLFLGPKRSQRVAVEKATILTSHESCFWLVKGS